MGTAALSKIDAVAIPSPDELIARARAMIPALKARARACVAARDVSVETMAEFHEAGFFRILQPKRWGGYEMHPNVFFEVQKALAEGCMSTGWMYGVVGCHPYELALFHDQAQREVWGSDSSTLASSSYQPVGKITRVDGGFRLSGRWNFSTGSVHCNWVLLGAIVPPEKADDPFDMRTFLLPRSDYTIDQDTWHVVGLQGTGSHDIIVDDAFIPEYRTHKSIDGFTGKNPGVIENTALLFALPWAQVFTRSVSTAAFGGAQTAIDGAIEIMNSRISTNTGKVSKADPILHAAIAQAISQRNEMETTLRLTFDELMDYAARGEEIPMDKRAFFVYQSSTVVRRLARLIDDIVQLLGGRAIYMTSPILQPWLDLNAGRAHVANDPNNRTGDMIGTMMGQPPMVAFL